MGLGRNREIKIRLSGEEHATLLKKRGKMRLATWMRESCINGMPSAIPTINQSALSELHRVGINLNQIAVRLNVDQQVHISETLDQISQLKTVLVCAAPGAEA